MIFSMERPEADAALSPLAEEILGALTSKVQNAKQLAHALGRKLNSYFREQLQLLAEHNPPLLLKSGNGYRTQK
jgi:hypothetical protein